MVAGEIYFQNVEARISGKDGYNSNLSSFSPSGDDIFEADDKSSCAIDKPISSLLPHPALHPPSEKISSPTSPLLHEPSHSAALEIYPSKPEIFPAVDCRNSVEPPPHTHLYG
ncbi:unnamed protein product [Arabidopsis lyrata]|uniref:Predicted protein n=1 Tax=Arabidopsis lyrata subsp. lyrata TaxID=81972 RepID=D7KQF3_ARALL|nr:predicted protein [Arabidopsis lyrata subsp. lyrata]CAH8252186.1 unnamed protein product [Arabidopsis lyrata]